MQTEFGGIERRSRTRYSIVLKVAYHTHARTRGASGVGRTRDVSSRGLYVAFQGDQKVRTGARVEIVVDWPALLHGTTALQLTLLGRVVRSDTDGFAMSLERHEFRTKKKS